MYDIGRNQRDMLTQILSLVMVFQSGASSGQSLLDASYRKLLKVHSVTFTMRLEGGDAAAPGTTVAMAKGGAYRMKTDSMELVSTPDAKYMLVPAQKRYQKLEDGGDSAMVGLEAMTPGQTPPKAAGDATLIKVAGKEAYRVPLAVGSGRPSVKQALLIDKATSYPKGVEFESEGTKSILLYDEFAVDTLTDEYFVWSPPVDWSPAEPQAGGAPQGEDEYTAKLLKVGTQAPKFSAQTPEGKKTSLDELRKGKKATLVNFWFYG
jgi:hypothetical protein